MGGVLACRLRLALPPRFLPGVGRGWGQGAGLYHSVGGAGDRGRGCPTPWAGLSHSVGGAEDWGQGSPTRGPRASEAPLQHVATQKLREDTYPNAAAMRMASVPTGIPPAYPRWVGEGQLPLHTHSSPEFKVTL